MSSYVYGVAQYLPIDEKHPVRPCNPYMGSKFIGEEVSRQLCYIWKKPLIVLRGFSIYGDGMPKGRLIADLVVAAKKGRPLIINDAKAKRDYLYIKDFCALILKIIGKNTIRSGTYNVGYGRSYSTLEVAALIEKLSHNKSHIIVRSAPRKNDIPNCQADNGLISRTFSWEPAHSLVQGLSEILAKR
jgi:nucleoside-diphosphate-sugar epimerase